MKKETYTTKLAATVMTDANTLGEAKEAKKLENTLKRFWKNAAIKHIKATTGRDLNEKWNWKDVRFDFNLKPNGSIKIEVWAEDDRFPAVFEERFTVAKKDLLK